MIPYRRKIISLYSHNSETDIFNIWIPAILGVGAFLPRFLIPEYGIPLGIIAIGFLAAHAYFLKIAKENKLNEIECWKKMSDDYQWLLYAIRRLIYHKKKAYDKFTNYKIDFGKGSVYKILEMLYQFYVYRSSGAVGPVKFRIAFFAPSDDGTFLTCKFHHYGDDQYPHFYGDEIKERKLFDKELNDSIAVQAWKTRELIIAESEKDIKYHYDGQKVRIRSMIAFPVLGQVGTDVAGIITICADKDFFFKQKDITLHKEIIYEFGIRIALEIIRLKKRLEFDDTID